MTTLLFRDRRRSRYLFDWSARYSLERGSMDAITGQVASLIRGSVGNTFDQNGLLIHSPGLHLPKVGWYNFTGLGSEPAVLIEPARTNLALHKRDLTNASWVKTNMTTARTQVGIDGVLNTATLLTATAANATCLQTVVSASANRVQSASIRRAIGVGNIQMTTDGGATWTTVVITGTYGQYQIPFQLVTNPQFGFRIVTNGDAIVVDWVMNEQDAFQGKQMTSPIGVIADNAVSESRSFDKLTYPISFFPQALTYYADIICLNIGDPNTNFHIMNLGQSGAPYFLMRMDGTTLQADSQSDMGAGSHFAQVGVSPVYGNRVEMRAVLQADGANAVGQCINGGAESTSGPGSTQALAAAWSDPNLYIGSFASGSQMGCFAVRQARIASGAQSMAYMREG